jgi:hypothetical protein
LSVAVDILFSEELLKYLFCLRLLQKEEEYMQVGEVCVGVLRAACRRVADNINDSSKQPSTASKTAGENERDAERGEAGMRERSGEGESRERKGRKEKTKKTKSELSYDPDLTSEDEEEEEEDDDDNVVEKEEDDGEDSEKEEDEDEDDTSTNEDSESEGENDADKSDKREIIVQDRYCPPLPASLSYECTNSVGSVQQQTGAFQEVLVTVFKHPVIQNWLFAEGFLQRGSVRRAVFEKLCRFVKELSELDEVSTHADSSSSSGSIRSRSFSIDSLCDLRSKCTWLMQHMSGAQTSPNKGKAKSPKSSKKGKSPSSKKEETKEDVQDSAKSVQSSLALCLDALFSVCDDAAKLKCLLEIVKSGPENFIAEAGYSEPSPLGKTVVSLAEALPEKAVENWLKNGFSRDGNESLKKKSGAVLTGDGGAESVDGSDSQASTDTNFTASVQGLLSLAASLKSASIDSLTLTFFRHFPASSSACLLSTFDLLFTRALSEQSSGVQGLVESLLRNSPECFAICRKRLKKWRKTDSAAQAYASIMRLYLGLVLKRQGKLSVCCCYCVNVVVVTV